MIASKLLSRTFLRYQSTAAAAAVAYNSKNVPVHQTKVAMQSSMFKQIREGSWIAHCDFVKIAPTYVTSPPRITSRFSING